MSGPSLNRLLSLLPLCGPWAQNQALLQAGLSAEYACLPPYCLLELRLKLREVMQPARPCLAVLGLWDGSGSSAKGSAACSIYLEQVKPLSVSAGLGEALLGGSSDSGDVVGMTRGDSHSLC